MRAPALSAALGLLLAAPPAAAHEFAIRDVLVSVHADGTYRADVQADVDALALGASPATDDAELVAALEAMSADELAQAVDRARDTVRRRLRIRFDGAPDDPAVEFPGDPPDADRTRPSVLGTIVRLRGTVPDGAGEMVFNASRAFGAVRLRIHDERMDGRSETLLAPGERSTPFRLNAVEAPVAPGSLGTAGRYAALGFDHILPRGVDHMLFVLGLFLLSARLSPLLWQVSAFTVAHTVTLAMSTAGFVALPSRIVEPLIALSIAYVAVENLVTETLHPWRTALVFAFGLLHGLGFAGALREMGLPRGEWLSGLISFNIGVELGQLAVIGLAWLAVGWFRERAWYRARIVRPASLAIALIALYWTFERISRGA